MEEVRRFAAEDGQIRRGCVYGTYCGPEGRHETLDQLGRWVPGPQLTVLIILARFQSPATGNLKVRGWKPGAQLSTWRVDSAITPELKTPRESQLIRAELPSYGYPQPSGSSRLPRQSDFIQVELPSNGYPTPSGSFHLSAYFKPLRHIWADLVRPLWTRGVPPPGTCPFPCLSLFPPLVPLNSFPFIPG